MYLLNLKIYISSSTMDSNMVNFTDNGWKIEVLHKLHMVTFSGTINEIVNCYLVHVQGNAE